MVEERDKRTIKKSSQYYDKDRESRNSQRANGNVGRISKQILAAHSVSRPVDEGNRTGESKKMEVNQSKKSNHSVAIAQTMTFAPGKQ